MRGTTTLALALALVAAAACVGNAQDAGTTSTSTTTVAAPIPSGTGFRASGLDGGGLQNTVAVDPHGTGLVLTGGDVSGIQRSTDGGRTWATANAGVKIGVLSVATLAFHPTVPNKVYAGLGFNGPGGLAVSTDGGQTWTTRSTVPRFSGMKGAGGGRSTGNLLAIDAASGFLYAATLDRGVLRSADDGATWKALGPSGKTLRSLGFDPANPDVLYVATYGDRVYKTTTARGAGTFAPLPASPQNVEELAVSGSSVFAAAGPGGVLSSGDGGQTWKPAGVGVIRTDGPAWLSVEAFRSGTSTTVYAGSIAPTKGGTGHDSVVRSTDGGLTWTSVTRDPARVVNQMGGPGGEPWWLAVSRPTYKIGHSGFIANHIDVDPTDPSRVFVAGRGGVWGSTDTATTWYPLVRGIGATVVRSIAADPNVAGRVYTASADFPLHSSIDGMQHVKTTAPPAGINAAHAIALDPATTPSTVYLGVGNSMANNSGEVWSTPDPLAGKWTNEGLAAVAGASRALGVAVKRVGGSRVILAAVQGSGIWRKAGTTWTKVNGVAMTKPQKTPAASLVWSPDSSYVYLYDHQSGVWRSDDDGRTWAQIWSKPSPYDMTGFLAIDPKATTTLFVSVGLDGVYRLDKANAGTVGAGITPVKVGTFASPGPIAMGADGQLYVAEVATWMVDQTFSVSADRGATWQRLDDAVFRGGAVFPTGLAIGADGSQYVSIKGNGVLAGAPVL